MHLGEGVAYNLICEVMFCSQRCHVPCADFVSQPDGAVDGFIAIWVVRLALSSRGERGGDLSSCF